MKWFTREYVGALAALALLAGVVTGREKPTLEVIEDRKPAKAAVEEIDLTVLDRRGTELPANDPFAVRSFSDERSPQRSVEKPSAPPLPFRYFGKVIEDGKLEVFVMHGDETLAARRGAKLGDYRVDAVSEKSITFTYLPLNTRQTLDISAVN